MDTPHAQNGTFKRHQDLPKTDSQTASFLTAQEYSNSAIQMKSGLTWMVAGNQICKKIARNNFYFNLLIIFWNLPLIRLLERLQTLQSWRVHCLIAVHDSLDGGSPALHAKNS